MLEQGIPDATFAHTLLAVVASPPSLTSDVPSHFSKLFVNAFNALVITQ